MHSGPGGGLPQSKCNCYVPRYWGSERVMGFTESISTVFSKYATFTGRASRSEFWWFTLFAFIVSVVLRIGHLGPGRGVGILYLAWVLATFIPSLAVAVRRLHDSDRSGWWWLIVLIPIIGWIVYIYFQVQPSTPGSNRFG